MTSKNIGKTIKNKISKVTGSNKNSSNSLEIKFKNVAFEIVGQDKLCSLSDIVKKGCDDKIIVTIPQYIFEDLEELARKYLKSTGLDIFAYLHSEFLKNILQPYKGIKGSIGDRHFMIWKEKDVIVVAVETK